MLKANNDVCKRMYIYVSILYIHVPLLIFGIVYVNWIFFSFSTVSYRMAIFAEAFWRVYTHTER